MAGERAQEGKGAMTGEHEPAWRLALLGAVVALFLLWLLVPIVGEFVGAFR